MLNTASCRCLLLALASLFFETASAKPVFRPSTNNTATVDLGYASYQGYATISGINNFLGMRYAAPPLGSRRFRLPEDPLPETDLVQATQHGPVCCGVANPATPAPPLNYSEDCLYIDVYAPANASRPDSAGVPVMLWIQGGGYVQNYNPNYNGTGLLEASGGNVIVVTFNYRVGPYGFLASSDLQVEGSLNAGFYDQLAAIEWVQKHISAFGGDPTWVTIFGTSVGGGSVLLHNLAYGGKPPANDIPVWSAGIGESLYLPSFLTVDQAQFQYDHLLSATNCTTLDCLRSVPTDHFQDANMAIPFPGQNETALFGYSPVIDGRVFPDRPLNLLEQGRFFKNRPLILGSSESDGTIFTPQVNSTLQAYEFLKAQLPGLTVDSFEQLNRIYADVPATYPGVNTTEAPLYYRTATIYSDLMFLCPAVTFAAGFSDAGISTHMFLDRIQDPVEVAAGYLTPHTWEVQAVWGPEYSKAYVALPGANSYDVGKSNAAIVPLVQAYWTSFTTSFGNPNALKLSRSPSWLEFGDGRFLSLRTNATQIERLSDELVARCAFWERLTNETLQ